MIPDFQATMKPILEVLSDDKERTIKEIVEIVAEYFRLNDEERNERYDVSGVKIFYDRVSWAVSHLTTAGTLQRPRRGVYRISESGKLLLGKRLEKISVGVLNNFQRTGQTGKKKNEKTEETNVALKLDASPATPEEIFKGTYSLVCDNLANELLATVRATDWNFFERLVVDLLVKMGYGGSRQDAGRVIGRSGDGGVDGVVNEDKLGLDVLYIQAKKYDSLVPIGHVRDFAGALLAKKALKGVFITTSTFPKSAYDFVAQIDRRIILIDGNRLARLMIEHNVGVAVKETYEIKRVDAEYFEDV